MTTNYERIKNMSVDEMAEFFLTFIPYCLEKDNIHYAGVDANYYPNAEMAIYCGKQWLESEVDNDR